MLRNLRKFNNFAVTCALIAAALALGACEDVEVADFNPEFRPVPTVERAPTIQAAPTIDTVPTVAKFEGFEPAPTTEKFEGFEKAPTVAQSEGFKQAPTVTQFEGFSDDDPCTTFLENPTPENARNATRWATGYLDGAGGQIDPNDNLRVTAACEAVLGNFP